MEKYQTYHQPELDLIHQNNHLTNDLGRLAIETLKAISHKISHKDYQPIQTFEERMVIDLIEDDSCYGSIYNTDGSETQLVFPISELPAYKLSQE